MCAWLHYSNRILEQQFSNLVHMTLIGQVCEEHRCPQTWWNVPVAWMRSCDHTRRCPATGAHGDSQLVPSSPEPLTTSPAAWTHRLPSLFTLYPASSFFGGNLIKGHSCLSPNLRLHFFLRFHDAPLYMSPPKPSGPLQHSLFVYHCLSYLRAMTASIIAACPQPGMVPGSWRCSIKVGCMPER